MTEKLATQVDSRKSGSISHLCNEAPLDGYLRTLYVSLFRGITPSPLKDHLVSSVLKTKNETWSYPYGLQTMVYACLRLPCIDGVVMHRHLTFR